MSTNISIYSPVRHIELVVMPHFNLHSSIHHLVHCILCLCVKAPAQFAKHLLRSSKYSLMLLKLSVSENIYVIIQKINVRMHVWPIFNKGDKVSTGNYLRLCPD